MNTYNKNIDFKKFPDKNGRFGEYGGRFVAETLMPLLLDLERESYCASDFCISMFV